MTVIRTFTSPLFRAATTRCNANGGAAVMMTRVNYFCSPGLETIHPVDVDEGAPRSTAAMPSSPAATGVSAPPRHAHASVTCSTASVSPVQVNSSSMEAEFIANQTTTRNEYHTHEYLEAMCTSTGDNTEFLLQVATASPTHGFKSLKNHQLFQHHQYMNEE